MQQREELATQKEALTILSKRLKAVKPINDTRTRAANIRARKRAPTKWDANRIDLFLKHFEDGGTKATASKKFRLSKDSIRVYLSRLYTKGHI